MPIYIIVARSAWKQNVGEVHVLDTCSDKTSTGKVDGDSLGIYGCEMPLANPGLGVVTLRKGP